MPNPRELVGDLMRRVERARVESDRAAALFDPRTTHGICDRCLERLQLDGASRPLQR